MLCHVWLKPEPSHNCHMYPTLVYSLISKIIRGSKPTI